MAAKLFEGEQNLTPVHKKKKKNIDLLFYVLHADRSPKEQLGKGGQESGVFVWFVCNRRGVLLSNRLRCRRGRVALLGVFVVTEQRRCCSRRWNSAIRAGLFTAR